jgi:hypothetical protein
VIVVLLISRVEGRLVLPEQWGNARVPRTIR